MYEPNGLTVFAGFEAVRFLHCQVAHVKIKVDSIKSEKKLEMIHGRGWVFVWHKQYRFSKFFFSFKILFAACANIPLLPFKHGH